MLNRIIVVMNGDWTRQIDTVTKFSLPSDCTILNVHCEYYPKKNETHIIYLIDEKE